MNTKIYNDYQEFSNREDKNLNGISKDFAELTPDWERDNLTNRNCWNCSDCSGCSDCYDCSYCSDCSDCSDCFRCYGCSDCYDSYECSGCFLCSDCFRCSGCSDCFRRYDKKNEKSEIIVMPFIENIHSTVLKAASCENALDMSKFHTCETTHCRAGWVITLAGDAGKELESLTSPMFAAMQIYHKSSHIKVSPVRFFESNKKAMDDMRRCAKEEMANL